MQKVKITARGRDAVKTAEFLEDLKTLIATEVADVHDEVHCMAAAMMFVILTLGELLDHDAEPDAEPIDMSAFRAEYKDELFRVSNELGLEIMVKRELILQTLIHMGEKAPATMPLNDGTTLTIHYDARPLEIVDGGRELVRGPDFAKRLMVAAADTVADPRSGKYEAEALIVSSVASGLCGYGGHYARRGCHSINSHPTEITLPHYATVAAFVAAHWTEIEEVVERVLHRSLMAGDGSGRVN